MPPNIVLIPLHEGRMNVVDISDGKTITTLYTGKVISFFILKVFYLSSSGRLFLVFKNVIMQAFQNS